MRFTLRQRIAADQHAAAFAPAEDGHQFLRQIFRLVGDDAPAHAVGVQRVEHVRDAVEQHAVAAEDAFVGIEKGLDQCFARVGVEMPERGADHRPRAFGDVRAQRVVRHIRLAVLAAQDVDRLDHVGRAVQQGAVKIEKHAARVRAF